MQHTLAVAGTRAMISSNTYRLYDKYANIADDEGFTEGTIADLWLSAVVRVK